MRDRFLTSDPGFVRLDTAARATAAVALTTGVMLAAARVVQMPQAVAIIAAVASWVSAISVNDPKLADRRVTTALIPIPLFGGMALGTAVEGNPLVEDLLFLAVVFAGIYVRRFGQRYFALGTVGFLAYFFALFVGTKADLLPPLLIAIVAGTASTYVMRFVFFPKHRQGSLWSVMQSVAAQLRLAIAEGQRSPRSTGARVEALVHNLARVNETMLAVEEQGIIAATFEDLEFRCELAAEDFLVTAQGGDDAALAQAKARVLASMEEARRAAQSNAPDPDASSPERDAILAEAVRATVTRYGMRPTTRQAIQVTAAAAAAILAGEHISPQRWYWAVFIAFVVFSGTSSSGETVARAWASALGTMIGVIAGTAVGQLVHGRIALESGLLFASMLFTAYFLRTTYGVAIFFVTTMIVTLYSLLGRFTEMVLLVRFLEVVTGATFGSLAALVLLPTPTRQVFRADVLAALEALRDGLRALAQPEDAQRRAAARRCDAALRRLRQRVDPLHSGPTFAGFSGFARRWLWGLELCAYHLRAAVASASETLPAAAAAEGRLDGLLTAIGADEEWPHPGTTLPEIDPPAAPGGDAARAAGAIDGVLARLC